MKTIYRIGHPLTGIVGDWRSVVGTITEKYLELDGFGWPFSRRGDAMHFLHSWMEHDFMTIDRKNELYRVASVQHAAEERAKAKRILDDAIQYEKCLTCGAWVPYVGDPPMPECCCCGGHIFRMTWSMHLDGEELERSNEEIEQRVYEFEARHNLEHTREHAQGFALLERGLMPEPDPEDVMWEPECP